MISRIKFIAKFFVAVVVLAAYASCDFNPCVRGEGAKTECDESMYLYVLNATDNEVQIGDLKLQPSEKKELTSSYYGDVIGLLVAHFGGDSVSVAKFVFDDSVTLQHKAFFADSNNRMYDFPSSFVPLEHNIFDYQSWQIGFVDDSWERWGCYTITNEDYQRALQQNAR